VHLTATAHGLDAAPGNRNLLWTMPLVQRSGGGARLRRSFGGVEITPMRGNLADDFTVHGEPMARSDQARSS
jgi:hypothetical protein